MDETEFIDGVRLEPENVLFAGKDKLRKSAADLTDEQIEYLSVAFLENDLPADQLPDLQGNLEQKRESRIVFDLIQKTKLTPPVIFYEHKSSLKRLTVKQKVFRMTTAGLSAAAAITVLILSYVFVPGFLPVRNNQVVSEIIQENSPETLLIAANKPIIVRSETVSIETDNIIPGIDISQTAEFVENTSMSETISMPDPSLAKEVITVLPVAAVFVPGSAGIDYQVPQLSLIASDNNFVAVAYDDSRGRVRRFIASAFREKILREKTYSDGPLRPYEIAKGSVAGINKLLGWDMEIKETQDKSGEVKSVYFSSTLLSFNAPVKKTDE